MKGDMTYSGEKQETGVYRIFNLGGLRHFTNCKVNMLYLKAFD